MTSHKFDPPYPLKQVTVLSSCLCDVIYECPLTSSFSSSSGNRKSTMDPKEFEAMRNFLAKSGGRLPFVYTRRGSMSFDQDGDLAHEFYEEVLPKKAGGIRRMRKIKAHRLTPQGDVKYASPRLDVDFAIILSERRT